jgi:hypothetical protein
MMIPFSVRQGIIPEFKSTPNVSLPKVTGTRTTNAVTYNRGQQLHRNK